MKLPIVSIVIPTYGHKGVELTKGCLEALWESGLVRPNDPDQSKHSQLVPEVLVIDDGSDLESLTELQKICTDNGVMRLIHNEVNTAHFGANVNKCIRYSSGQVVIVLNNDVRVMPGCIQAMVQAVLCMNFGLVAPKLIYPDTDDYPEQFRGKIQFGGMVHVTNPQDPNNPGWFDHALRFQPRHNFSSYRVSDGLLTGACLGIGRGALDMVGMFDERFELTCEDVDYSLRVMLAGLPCVYLGTAEAIHMEGASRGNTVDEKAKHPEWNEREARSLEFLFEKWPIVNFSAFNSAGVWQNAN